MNKLNELILKCLSYVKKYIYKDMTDGQMELLAQIIRFCFVGGVNTLVSYGVTVLCLFLGYHLLVSNAVAFVISTACAFILNYLFVFNPRPCWWKGIIKSYCSYALTGIGLNSLLLYLLSNIMGVSEYLSPLLVLFVTIPCNFLLNKLWTFKK